MHCFFWFTSHNEQNGPIDQLSSGFSSRNHEQPIWDMYINEMNCNILLISMNIEIYFMIPEHIGCYCISEYFINNGILQFCM